MLVLADSILDSHMKTLFTVLKATLLTVLIGVILGLGAYKVLPVAETAEQTPPASINNTPLTTPKSTPANALANIATPTPAPTPVPTPAPLPSQVYLKVPFMVQAPFAKWDPLHEDACEETSLLIVKHYLDKTDFSSKAEADKEIIDFTNYVEQSGYGLSITLQELNQLALDRYRLSGKVKTNITVEDIKKELANGHPVIVGAAGKILPNPYFSNGGPVYHMLVVTGYDEKGFITNDPGVRQGENFRYTYDDLYNSIHNWDPQDIMKGEKAMLVF